MSSQGGPKMSPKMSPLGRPKREPKMTLPRNLPQRPQSCQPHLHGHNAHPGNRQIIGPVAELLPHSFGMAYATAPARGAAGAARGAGGDQAAGPRHCVPPPPNGAVPGAVPAVATVVVSVLCLAFVRRPEVAQSGLSFQSGDSGKRSARSSTRPSCWTQTILSKNSQK